jgi:hypothetical protein
MLRPVHHTKSSDAWHTEVLPLLPPDLDTLAFDSGAYQRCRAFDCASDLLRGLLAYAATASSLRHLGAWAVLQDLADLSPSAWLTRLRAATSFLHALVNHRLKQPRPRWLSQAVRSRLLLLDATWLGLAHGTGDDLRLHVAYDLLAGQLDQLVLTPPSKAEHLRHFTLRAGDLLVSDAGYGYRDRVAVVQDADADIIVRIYPPTFPLEHADGRRFDLRSWLDRSRSEHASALVYYSLDGTRRAVRVLAWRKSEPKRRAAQARAKERARRKQRELSEVVQYFADWVVLVTTLLDPLSWPDQAVWRVYQARWQIELLFKRLKQHLVRAALRVRSVESAVPLVWAVLLVWLLHEPYQQELKTALSSLAEPAPAPQVESEAVVSAWSLSALVLDTLRMAIRGVWTQAQVMAALPRLVRYLVTRARADREHQATEVVAWLSGIRRTRRRVLADAV